MSVAKRDDEIKKVTASKLQEMKLKGEKISMLTAYDFTMATLIDQGGVDVILVGDSASNVMAGYDTTLPITVDEMIYHASAVVRGVRRALVVCDMPFGSYQVEATEGVRNAVRMVQKSGCDALKLEGGIEIVPTAKASISSGRMRYGLKKKRKLKSCWTMHAPSKKQDALRWCSKRSRRLWLSKLPKNSKSRRLVSELAMLPTGKSSSGKTC